MTTDSILTAVDEAEPEAEIGPDDDDLLDLADGVEIEGLDQSDDESLEPEPELLVGTVTDLVALNPAEAVATPAEVDTADDDVLITDEVEASLDVILAERMRARDVEVDDEPEDEEDGDEAPDQLATVIPVRRPDEFLCQSCFLLKPPGQLADADHQLCRDCA